MPAMIVVIAVLGLLYGLAWHNQPARQPASAAFYRPHDNRRRRGV